MATIKHLKHAFVMFLALGSTSVNAMDYSIFKLDEEIDAEREEREKTKSPFFASSISSPRNNIDDFKDDCCDLQFFSSRPNISNKKIVFENKTGKRITLNFPFEEDLAVVENNKCCEISRLCLAEAQQFFINIDLGDTSFKIDSQNLESEGYKIFLTLDKALGQQYYLLTLRDENDKEIKCFKRLSPKLLDSELFNSSLRNQYSPDSFDSDSDPLIFSVD